MTTFPQEGGPVRLSTPRRAALLLLVALMIVQVPFVHAKIRALAMHPQDYCFYAQFLARMGDAALTPQYFLNPNGQNALGFWGTEGERNLHQSIHFEPVKYLEGMLYRLAPDPMAVFLFRLAVLFFAPAYLLLVWPAKSRQSEGAVALVAIAYAVAPALPFVATFDLRPFTYLVPLLFMATVAVLAKRPPLETAFFFNLLFLAREEALVLAGILLVLRIAVSADLKRDARLLFFLGACWTGWLLLTFGFFLWTGYHNAYEMESVSVGKLIEIAGRYSRQLVAALAAGGAGLLLIVLLRRPLRAVWRNEFLRRLIAFGLFFLPMAWQFYTFFWKGLARRNELDTVGLGTVLCYDEHWALFGCCLLLFVLLLLQGIVRPRFQAGMRHALQTYVVMAVALSVFPLASPGRQFMKYRAEAADAAALFDFRDSLDRHQTAVLCDYDTCQLFYGFEHVVVLQRLPAYMKRGEERYFPANAPVLKDLLERQTDCVVISTNSINIATELFAGLPANVRVTPGAGVGRYRSFRITRGDISSSGR